MTRPEELLDLEQENRPMTDTSDLTLQWLSNEEILPYLEGHHDEEVYRQALDDEGHRYDDLDVTHGWIRKRPVPDGMGRLLGFDVWIICADPHTDYGATPITYDAGSWPLGSWTEEGAVNREQQLLQDRLVDLWQWGWSKVTRQVLAEVLGERERAVVDRGFTPQHDDERGEDYLVEQARCRLTGGVDESRRQELLEAAGLLVAALELRHRHSKQEVT